MNRKQLRKLGLPEYCLDRALRVVQRAGQENGWRGAEMKSRIKSVVADPQLYKGDPYFGELAEELLVTPPDTPRQAVEYPTWGEEIDESAHAQMQQACTVPGVTAGALMADAHLGYGLPIGGVLAVENAVIPYAVGVDIACRMKMSVLDLPVSALEKQHHSLCDALNRGTRFGVGSVHEKPQDHPVLDEDWTVTRVTRQNKDKARKQLGTSGSGNHFVEFGVLTLDAPDAELGLEPGEYIALLSHSGSRGTGASVCSTYSSMAQAALPREYADFGRLAWLSLDSEAGQEYWAAMNLMGEYAAANHAVIHRLVTGLLGARVVAGVENHHNFAWLEEHGGQEVVVHRKGATPAGAGVLGVIPGSMADPAFVVRGRGVPESLASASHGAGRRMSRKKAKATYRFSHVRRDLAKRGIHVLSAGSDEVPGVYKDIREVMQAQRDLVDVVARFDPRIVKMCGDGSRAED